MYVSTVVTFSTVKKQSIKS